MNIHAFSACAPVICIM